MKIYAGAALLVLVLMFMLGSGGITLADDPTATFTPSPTANFVLPLINVPIVLPTAFFSPLPTEIAVHVTAAPNMNPYGLEVPGNPIWAWMEGMNISIGIFKVMGWMGELLFFVFILLMSLAMLNKMRRIIMNGPQAEGVGKAPIHLKKLPKGKVRL